MFTLDSKGQPQEAVSHGIKSGKDYFSDTIVQETLRTRKGLFISDLQTHSKFTASESIVNLKLKSALCTPIIVSEKLLGIIYIGCRHANKLYSQEDLDLLDVYASLSGMLIENINYILEKEKTFQTLVKSEKYSAFLGDSPQVMKILERLDTIAPSDISVFIQGETGTGKEVIADLIHKNSLRIKHPFVAVNCSSLRGELLESELFGYKKGAFTGAIVDRKGLFQAADGGTIFLDELGEMDLNLQAKLLRVLESGKVRPLGALQEEAVDVRVLGASNRHLKEMVEKEEFREDLYFRIAQVTLTLPPLRERGEDIRLLAYYFLEKYKVKYPGKEFTGFHPAAIQVLHSYNWPGNVRELLNVIHRSVLTSTPPLVSLDMEQTSPGFENLEEASKKFQRNYILKALAFNGGNKENTAKQLEVSRSTFFRYLSQLGIDGEN